MEVRILKKNASKGFSLLAGINRPINPSQVTKLSNSIDMMGIIRPVVIAKIDFLDAKSVDYIIDGQHLYTALLRLNKDIPYTEIKVKDTTELVEKIAMLNASSKCWTLLDYIQSWKVVSKDYVTLQTLFQRYDIDMSQLAEILHGYTNPLGKSISRTLKAGKFKIKNLDHSITVLDKITDALKFIPRLDRVSNKSFIAAFVVYTLQPQYNHAKTLKYLKDNKDKFTLSTHDPEEFSILFDKI